ncbi:MAG: hypothetical protein ACLTMM_07205 [Lachnospiraceae bacterium]|nr:hypothetical protein [Acutalibacteraceae bacterium]CDC78563.1 putative uncharacterized protein [Clostridium sp. CAG:964]
MGFSRKKKSRKKLKNTRQLMGVASIHDDYLRVFSNKIKVALLIKPTNINVLSDEVVISKITSLMNVLKTVSDVELLCVNSTQNYDDNISYLNNLVKTESNIILQDLNKKTIDFLNSIRVNMATNREFFVQMTFNASNTTDDTRSSAVRRTLQQLREGGFIVRLANNEDYKRILTIYYDSAFNDDYSDYDGLKYITESDEVTKYDFNENQEG